MKVTLGPNNLRFVDRCITLDTKIVPDIIEAFDVLIDAGILLKDDDQEKEN